jgi:hypothetical protein
MQSLTVARSFIASQLDISWYFLGALSHRDIAWLRYSVIFLSQVKQIWQHLAATDTFLSQDDSIAPSPRAKLRIAILSLVQAMVPWFHGAELVSRFLRNPRFSRKTHDLHRFAGSKWFKTIVFPSKSTMDPGDSLSAWGAHSAWYDGASSTARARRASDSEPSWDVDKWLNEFYGSMVD